MELTFEMVAFAVVVLVLNVMDSVTTYLCFRQYPDKELKGEANPIMRWLMLKSRMLAEVFKQAIGVGVIVYFLFGDRNLPGLRYLAILLGLVVLNNAYIFVSRAITGRKLVTPFKALATLFRLSEKYDYMVIVLILLSLAGVICRVVWG